MKLLSLLAATSMMSLALAAIGCAAPSVDDSEGTGETEQHQLGGSRLTPSEVAQHLRSAGFPEAAIGKMVCTAKYESSYYEKATNKNKNGSTDYGLFQINSVHLGDSACGHSSSALFDPTNNAKCALSIYKSQGINAWYGYQKHKSECDRTKAPGATGTTTTSSSGSTSTTTSSSGSTSTTTSSSGSTSTTTSSSGSTSTGDDDSSATIDPSSDYDLGGGCWSATMQDMMDPLSCVQSSSDNAWEQCKDGKWYRGTSVQGPYGYCNGTYQAGQSVSSTQYAGDDDSSYDTAH